VAKPRDDPEDDAGAVFQENMLHIVRSLGLHKPDETPCGQPVSVAEAHALLEIAREPGISQNGLAARLKLEKSTVSRVRCNAGATRLDSPRARSVRRALRAASFDATRHQSQREIARSRRAKFDRIFTAIPAARRRSVVDSLSLLLEVIRDA